MNTELPGQIAVVADDVKATVGLAFTVMVNVVG
jgi:hypothetical protein